MYVTVDDPLSGDILGCIEDARVYMGYPPGCMHTVGVSHTPLALRLRPLRRGVTASPLESLFFAKCAAEMAGAEVYHCSVR